MTKFPLLSRRRFGLGLGAALASVPFGRALAQGTGETRTITNWLGTYEIPANPRRIIAIDTRIDLETALVLDLNLLAYSDRDVQAWVPADPDMLKIGTPPNMEEILGLEPDLFICRSDFPDMDYWPVARLQEIAPVLPTEPQLGWRENLANFGRWLDVEGTTSALIAEYDALCAEIAARHDARLRNDKVVMLYLREGNQVYVRGHDSAQERVLRDIGGHTLSAEEFPSGFVSMENLPGLLADVSAIAYMDFSGDDPDYAALLEHPLWPRIPAVAAGKVYRSIGNTNFGGAYTAIQTAREWDALYSLLD